MTKFTSSKTVTIIIFFLILLISACIRDLNLSVLESTSTPKLPVTSTLTFTPSSTPTPVIVDQVIPKNYYRIAKTKLTEYNNGEIKSICIQTITHKVAKSISKEVVEITASSEYQLVIGDCVGSQPEQWSYQINIFTGEFIKYADGSKDSDTTYYGKNYEGHLSGKFLLSNNSIPVWRITLPISQRDFLDRLVIYEGTDEFWIDKATGILVYRKRFLTNVEDPTVTYLVETMGLHTNAPIGGILYGTEFSYSKEE